MGVQFSICVPDYKRGLVWCQHLNGSWAPPFPMKEWNAKGSTDNPDEPDAKSS